MVSIYELKPRFQALLRPLCRGLAGMGVTANQVTIAAVVLSAASGAWIAFSEDPSWALLMLPVVLFARMALNAIDGMLAREFDMQTALGGVLNEMGDVVSDALIYLPFALLPGMPTWGVIGIVLLAVMIEMVGVVSVQVGGTRRYDGPFGKSDRAFFFGTLGLIIGAGVAYSTWIDWLVIAALALSVWTGLNRAKKGLAEVGDTQC